MSILCIEGVYSMVIEYTSHNTREGLRLVAHLGDSPSRVSTGSVTRLRVPLLGNGLELRISEHTLLAHSWWLVVSGVRWALVFRLLLIRSRVAVPVSVRIVRAKSIAVPVGALWRL